MTTAEYGTRRYEVEVVLVKKSAVHKIGTDQDLDPDLDAAYVVEHCQTRSFAVKRTKALYKQYESRLMWNCVTMQEQVFGDDEGMPVWEPIGETKAYYGDRWE